MAAAEPIKDGKASQVLADYVRSRYQGGSDSDARAACAWALLSDQDLSNVLKTTAQQYLARLPATFPAASRRALEDLANPAPVDPDLQLEADFQGDASRPFLSPPGSNAVRKEESEGRPEARFAPGPAPGGLLLRPAGSQPRRQPRDAAFFRSKKPEEAGKRNCAGNFGNSRRCTTNIRRSVIPGQFSLALEGQSFYRPRTQSRR